MVCFYLLARNVEICVDDRPRGAVGNGVVPCAVNVVPAAVELYRVPGVLFTGRVARVHRAAWYAEHSHEHSECGGVAFAYRLAVYQRAVWVVAVLRGVRYRAQRAFIVGHVVNYVVVYGKLFFVIVHAIGNYLVQHRRRFFVYLAVKLAQRRWVARAVSSFVGFVSLALSRRTIRAF